jgi:hypothetical protein
MSNTIPVTNGTHTIRIKPKMDIGTRNLVQDELMRVSATSATTAAVSMTSGAYVNALLIHNVVAWSGPKLKDLEPTPENILSQDDDEIMDLLDQAANEIAKRNPIRKKKEQAEREGNSASDGAQS